MPNTLGINTFGTGCLGECWDTAATELSGVLGCGEYQTLILLRGGATVYMLAPFSEVSWTRVSSDTSEGKLSIASLGNAIKGPGGDQCCALLGGIRNWEHELAIIRDGDTIWTGPILIPEWDGGADAISIEARDLSAWWDHRWIHNDYTNLIPVDLSQIFEDISNDAMAPDDSPGIVISQTSTGIKGARSYLAEQHTVAGSELRAVATAGTDWTFIVRTCLVGASVGALAPLGPLIDEHLANVPKVRMDGTAKANRVGVTGSGSSGTGVYGEAADVTARLRDGLLETTQTDANVTTDAEAAQIATSSVALTSSSLPEVEDIILSSNAPVVVADLIPGRLISLNLSRTCVPVIGNYRLAKVSGVRNASGETITLTIQPPGASN